MKNRKINELPEGLRNRMIRLTVEYAVLSNKNVGERLKSLDGQCLSYRLWQGRSYHLMVAINKKLQAEGKQEKYVFSK